MPAFWALSYDLLVERCTEDISINKTFLFHHIKQRFHVAMGLYSNRSGGKYTTCQFCSHHILMPSRFRIFKFCIMVP